MSTGLPAPVSVFFYRRPDHLRQVMTKVREAKPPILFGISDGPKAGNEEIRRGVEESRKVFREMIDWPCQWELLERPVNLGSYLSVSGGLDWVFERVGETIVLEDDTVPDLSFFRFTAELLEKYRGDPKVGAVCGNNYDDPKDWLGNASYRFTRYHHSWGWGTWKRAWQYFDREEKLLAEVPKLRKENWMKLSRAEWSYWDRCFRRTYAKKLDAWDYRWTLSLWRNHMNCVIPKVNLVQNIGFDAKATHTVETNFALLEMHQIKIMKFPLHDPIEKKIHLSMDNHVFRSHYQALEGRRNIFEKLSEKLQKLFFFKRLRSSISDTETYRKACYEAATSPDAFARFKQNRDYKEILEHTSYETGLMYLESIKSNSRIYQNLSLFTQNDKFGGSETFKYSGIGNFSPSTLRYIKVLKDLIEKFKTYQDINIVEIGGGYGGQCLILQLFEKPKNYEIFDLHEPLLLTKKYLEQNNINNIKYTTLNNLISKSPLQEIKPDLIISNYAFSEIDKKIQKQYLDFIILKAKRGYITYNSISSSCGINSLSLKEITEKIKIFGPVSVEEESPLTFQGNKVIWWNWA